MAVTPTISRIVSINRNQGSQVPDCINLSQWVDTLSLSSGSAHSYTIPSDPNTDVRASILRISSNVGPVYVNPYATAAVVASNVTDGSGSTLLNPQNRPTVLALPAGCTALSFIAPANTLVSIEVWN